MSALLELASRCEAATQWDIALNEDIAVAIGWQRPMLPGVCGPNYSGRNRYEWHDTDQQPRGFYAPQFTGSLDVAVKLVPSQLFKNLRPGKWWWQVDSLGCSAHVAYENHDSGIPEYAGEAATPALALCAAALRALDGVDSDNAA